MSRAEEPLFELKSLDEKVRQAGELIARLRESNRMLASELAEVKRRLENQEAGEGGGAAVSPGPRPGGELAILRRERDEIRQRVSRLLQDLESLER